MPTPYELLRSRINELLPDRLTLGFGCEVLLKSKVSALHDKNTSLVVPCTVTFIEDYESWCNCDGGNCGVSYKLVQAGDHLYDITNADYEILGPPLTLADVLRAIEKTKNYWHWEVDDNDLLVPKESDGYGDWQYTPLDGLPLHLPVKDWPNNVLTAVYKLVK